MAITKEMKDALKADGEKLKQLTGDDHGPDFYFDDDEMSEEEERAREAEMNCSMTSDGLCMQAGSEYCEFECPFNGH